jgi:transcriptional regulator with XRE-family HTH domain
MVHIIETTEFLKVLGKRLRVARLERNDTMAMFGQRLGISEGTVRAMERGEPTVQIGTWMNALWMLDRLNHMQDVLKPRESLIDLARAQQLPQRQRAKRRRS